ncbi:LysE family translocator [Microlunatus parietis]|uniref:Threonine/homoserine/homoserine lactone efflux protein n=1 Tax=Microlunatus parietis TaxID=682979 RepID=A0A7Y9ICV4_9ACTN|nr:LysE family translocator [Microlunatus parietis]NYE74273.1 threonine/homoserine/homoserine lactone efflux protein [Microlunatus parietis]
MLVPLGNTLAFALAAFVLIIIPGPSVLFVVSRALAYGRRTAVLTVLGGALGSFVCAVGIAVGVGALLQASALAYTVLKFAGAGYLVYLGIRAIRHRGKLWQALEEGAAPVGGRRTFVEGFVVSVTNPKSMVFFAAVLPQFVDRAAGAPPGLQMIIFGAIFAAIALLSDTIWGLAASTVRGWFAASRRRLELVGGASGLTMIGLGVGVALNGRRD